MIQTRAIQTVLERGSFLLSLQSDGSGNAYDSLTSAAATAQRECGIPVHAEDHGGDWYTVTVGTVPVAVSREGLAFVMGWI